MATREAVHKLAAELNYQPNSVAMSLRQNRTNTIGVVVPEIVHYFFSSVISGIEDVVYEKDFQVILCQSNEKYQQEKMNIKTLIRSQVDGILISYSKQTRDFNHLEELKEMGVPVVFYDRLPDALFMDSVVVDDFGGSYKATSHLIEQGCRRIAHFKGPQHLKIHRERFRGYASAQQDAGLKVNPELVIEADSFKGGYKAVCRLVDQGMCPDGIFAVNDLTAVGAMKAIKSKNMKIPQDVAVVGFGDDSTLSEMVDPTLSSVMQPGYKMGQNAAQLLLDRINCVSMEEIQCVELETNLRVRRSSKRR